MAGFQGMYGRATRLSRGQALAPLAVFAFLLVAFDGVFGTFFPNPGGGLGHDYSYYMPILLAGEYWRQTNGFWSLPWFTPAFCGGQPLLPDPQSFYYSLPQFLTAWVDPLAALYLTFLVFAAAGFWGFYFLARRGFDAGMAVSLLGAALFMYNGFFVHRMLIGHITFHGVMLVPWVALALLGAQGAGEVKEPRCLVPGLLAGLCGAYWLYAGMLHLIIPSVLAICCLILIRQLRRPLSWRAIATRGAIATGVSAGLGAFKIAAALSFMQHFPRTDYSLPGVDSVAHALWLLVQTLFFAPAGIAELVAPDLRQVQWRLDRHEFEFGVGAVPLLALLGAAWHWLVHPIGRSARLWMGVSAMLALLAIPLAVNVYSPDWNAFLKRLPLLGASSNLFRWYFVYVPVCAMATVVLLQKLPARTRAPLAAAGIALTLLGNGFADRRFYEHESYDPAPITAGWLDLRQSGVVPEIRAVGDGGLPGKRHFPNDPLVSGVSGYPCYNPVFGYRLENLPVKHLTEGPIDRVQGGRLNLKNPACYVFPEANGCEPGDHFREAERDELLAFASYRPIAFERPTEQRVAEGISASTLVFCVGVLLWHGMLVAVAWLRRRQLWINQPPSR